jgi:hypothetical protein
MCVLMSTRRNGFVTNFYNLMKENCTVVLCKFIHTLHILNFTDFGRGSKTKDRDPFDIVQLLRLCRAVCYHAETYNFFVQLRGNIVVNQVTGREINILSHVY